MEWKCTYSQSPTKPNNNNPPGEEIYISDQEINWNLSI